MQAKPSPRYPRMYFAKSNAVSKTLLRRRYSLTDGPIRASAFATSCIAGAFLVLQRMLLDECNVISADCDPWLRQGSAQQSSAQSGIGGRLRADFSKEYLRPTHAYSAAAALPRTVWNITLTAGLDVFAQPAIDTQWHKTDQKWSLLTHF